MKRLLWCVFAVATLLSKGAHADTLTVSRTVLLPDGKPVAGAKVLVRTYDLISGVRKDEKRAVTDAAGHFTLGVENGLAKTSGAPQNTPAPAGIGGMIMVQTPDNTLTLERISPQAVNSRESKGVLHLAKGVRVSGTIVDEKGKPVANAAIAVRSLRDMPAPLFNRPATPRRMPDISLAEMGTNWKFNDADTATPELITGSDAAGKFALPTLDISGTPDGASNPPATDRNVSLSIDVSALTGGVRWAGEKLVYLKGTAVELAEPIVLSPIWSIKGRVVDSVTGEPVAGARVIFSEPPSNLTNGFFRPRGQVAADRDGNWELQERGANREGRLSITHPDYAPAHLTGTGQPVKTALPEQDVQDFDAGTVKLVPLVKIKVQLQEEATGAPPPPEALLNASIATKFGEPEPEGQILMEMLRVPAPVQSNGTAMLKAAPGVNSLSLNSSLFDLALPQTVPPGGSLEFNVPLQETAPLIIKLKPKPAFYVHFSAANLDDLNNLYIDIKDSNPNVRPLEGRALYVGLSEYWMHAAGRWGDTMQLRIVRLAATKNLWERQVSAEVIPWTTITADPKNWPLVIQVPASSKTAAG